MCKPKDKTPINCDVFCFEDVTRKQFGDINITGNLFIEATGVFKAGNLTVDKNLISEKTSLNLDHVQVKGKLIATNGAALFKSLVVKDSCVLTPPQQLYERDEESKLIDCDVFCVNGNFLPEDICITGNLYIANSDLSFCYPCIETGEDIFVDSTFLDADSIKCQGTTYVFGEERKFSFNSLTSLEGCELFEE